MRYSEICTVPNLFVLYMFIQKNELDPTEWGTLSNMIRNAPQTTKEHTFYRGLKQESEAKLLVPFIGKDGRISSNISFSKVLANAVGFTNEKDCCLDVVRVPPGSHVFDVEQTIPFLIDKFADVQSFAYHYYGQHIDRNPRQDILQIIISDQEVLLSDGCLRCRGYEIMPVLNNPEFAVRFCDYIPAHGDCTALDPEQIHKLPRRPRRVENASNEDKSNPKPTTRSWKRSPGLRMR